jgi:hypothetical protein
LVFPSISFHHGSPLSYIIWGMNNRPIRGCSSETKSHPINISNHHHVNSQYEVYELCVMYVQVHHRVSLTLWNNCNNHFYTKIKVVQVSSTEA